MGLYIIFGYNRQYSTLYTLTKLDDRPTKNIYHGDFPREFWSCQIYLILLREKTIEIYTKIHYKRDKVTLYKKKLDTAIV